MHRILISSPVIGSYSFCMLLGIVAGYFVARFNARRISMAGRHIDNVTLLAGIAGLAGARIFSWLFYFPRGFSLWKALTEPGGGMVFYGGVIFGFLTVVTYARLARVGLRDLLDVMAGPLALGLAIGRVGCFLAGCCWGDVCVDTKAFPPLADSHLRYQLQTVPFLSGPHFPFGVRFPLECGALEQHQKLGLVSSAATESLPVHPVQLYEATLALLLMFWLQRRFRARVQPGKVFVFFCVGYGAIRFALEFLRADNVPAYFGLTLSQVISLIPIVAATVWAIVRRSARYTRRGSRDLGTLQQPV
jgi:phosphatidylglycerol:prolipoprotein diacylglycerol transferase